MTAKTTTNFKWIAKLLDNFRRRAADAQLEFKLTRRDIESLWVAQQGLCYWFKLPMTTVFDAHTPARVSIDRLNNKRGYTSDNIVLASCAANMGRRGTPEEIFKTYCTQMLRTHSRVHRDKNPVDIGDVFDRVIVVDHCAAARRIDADDNNAYFNVVVELRLCAYLQQCDQDSNISAGHHACRAIGLPAAGMRSNRS